MKSSTYQAQHKLDSNKKIAELKFLKRVQIDIKSYICFRFLLLIPILLFLTNINSHAIHYMLNFKAIGASNSYDSVLVQNYNTGKQITVYCDEALHLTDYTAVQNVNEEFEYIKVYPNPTQDKATLSFYAKKTGNSLIRIYSLDGRQILTHTLNVAGGVNDFELTVPKGIFIIQVTGNGYVYNTKLISSADILTRPSLGFLGIGELPQKVSKAPTDEPKTLVYHTSDMLIYKGISGNYVTLMTDIPKTDKVVDIEFVECKDGDGNYYPVVKIGEQFWMAENLKTTRFSDGNKINNSGINGLNRIYQNGDYSFLYNFFSITDEHGIAPIGWHVSRDVDWDELLLFLGGNDVAGGKLKERGYQHWLFPNTNATNISQFSALPSGEYDPVNSNYLYQSYYGNWWTSKYKNILEQEFECFDCAWYRFISNFSGKIFKSYEKITKGFSVRCVKDNSNIIKDIDGNTYKTVKIGTQTWMAENLKTTRYRNGDKIPNIKTDREWLSLTTGAWCYFYNDSLIYAHYMSNYKNRGKLYNGYAIKDNRLISPTGWHVPTNYEWKTLQEYLGGEQIAASKLKVWVDFSDLCANNETGFSALILGNRFVSWYNNEEYVYFLSEPWYTYWSFWGNVSMSNRDCQMLIEEMHDIKNGYAVRCIKDEKPTLTTTPVRNIFNSSAQGGGNIIYDGGSEITACGVCWSTKPNPTVEDYKTSDGTGTDEFTSKITGLLALTKYYIRAYAVNSEGISYGNELSFTTNNFTETVTDIDGNEYKTVIIGNQCWMAENLKTTHYRNGDPVPNVPDANMWMNSTTGAWCDLNNDPAKGAIYGHLYNRFTIYEPRNIAPVGWRIPNENDWDELQDYLIKNGYNYDGTLTGNKIAQSMAAKKYWFVSNIEGSPGYNLSLNNRSGFSALPGNFRQNVDGVVIYDNEYTYSVWWSKYIDQTHKISLRYLEFVQQNLVHLTDYDNNYGFSIRCIYGEDTIKTCPTLTTSAVTNIGQLTAISGGNITSDGGAPITARGVCWSTSQNPTIAESKTTDGTDTGEFTSSITGLTANTTYYVRAYATNSVETCYGEELSFKTKDYVVESCGTVTDIDGNVYQTVKIGNQCWMAENLRTTKYRNGDAIPNVTDGTTWTGLTTGAWCAYDNNTSYASTYGLLYNWYTVIDNRGLAPDGWHVASADEWEEMANYLITNGYNFDGTVTENKIGKAVASTSNWWNNTVNGNVGNNQAENNKSGLNIPPAGARHYVTSSFVVMGVHANVYTSTEYNTELARVIGLYYDGNYLNLSIGGGGLKYQGASIRCVKD